MTLSRSMIFFGNQGCLEKNGMKTGGGQTYGEKTINKAISTNRETYKSPSDQPRQQGKPNNETVDSWPTPEPLKPERAENPNPYPIHALSPIIREAVEEFISFNPVPPALAGSVALGLLLYLSSIMQM